MDNVNLKKRFSTFKTAKGSIKGANNELLIDILKAWESWGGTARDFYGTLGLSKTQLGGLIGKAKRLIKSGVVVESEFKELKLDSMISSGTPCQGIELVWDAGKVIRFAQVEQVIEFLKKAA